MMHVYHLFIISVSLVVLTTAELNDDDDLVQNDIKIPFCRKGHSLSTGFILNDTSKQLEFSVLLFGGEGINYNDPTETFLKDIWSLKLTENKVNGQPFDFNWNLLDFDNSYLLSDWPERRSNFGASQSSSGFVIYGGENKQRLLQSRNDAINPFYGDMWTFVTSTKVWIPLQQTGITEYVSENQISSKTPSTETTKLNVISAMYADPNERNPVNPGYRKDSLLVVLPITNRAIVIGGEKYKKYSPSSEAKLSGNTQPNHFGGDILASGECESDVFMFNKSVIELAKLRSELSEDESQLLQLRGVSVLKWMPRLSVPVCT